MKYIYIRIYLWLSCFYFLFFSKQFLFCSVPFIHRCLTPPAVIPLQVDTWIVHVMWLQLRTSCPTESLKGPQFFKNFFTVYVSSQRVDKCWYIYITRYRGTSCAVPVVQTCRCSIVGKQRNESIGIIEWLLLPLLSLWMSKVMP